jgi:hypothetical protein
MQVFAKIKKEHAGEYVTLFLHNHVRPHWILRVQQASKGAW